MQPGGKEQIHFNESRLLKVLCDRVPLSAYLAWLSSEDHGEYTLFETTEGIGFIYEVFLPPLHGRSP